MGAAEKSGGKCGADKAGFMPSYFRRADRRMMVLLTLFRICDIIFTDTNRDLPNRIHFSFNKEIIFDDKI